MNLPQLSDCSVDSGRAMPALARCSRAAFAKCSPSIHHTKAVSRALQCSFQRFSATPTPGESRHQLARRDSRTPNPLGKTRVRVPRGRETTESERGPIEADPLLRHYVRHERVGCVHARGLDSESLQ